MSKIHEQMIYQTKNTHVLQTGNDFKPIINDKNANKTAMRFLPYNYLELFLKRHYLVLARGSCIDHSHISCWEFR